MQVWQSRGRAGDAKQVGVLFFYIVLTLGMTYPLVAHWMHGVLGPPGDNFEYLYKLAWFKCALFDLHVSPFFTPDVFYPEGYNLALHEMSLANVALGMPLTILSGETISYNALVLFSFVLSGFGAYLLVFHLTRERWPALLSGVVYAFGTYRMAHLGAGHLNLLGTQWLPFLFLCLEWMLNSGHMQSAILTGVFFALSALSSWYYAPMFALFGGAYVLWRLSRKQRLFQRRLWFLFTVSTAVSLLLMSPSIVLTAQQWSQREMTFSLREVDLFSASVGDWFVPNALHPWWGKWVAPYYAARQDVPEHMISLNWVALVLAVLALRPFRRRYHSSLGHRGMPKCPDDVAQTPVAIAPIKPTRPQEAELRRGASAFVLLFVLSVVLTLGTTLHVGGERVYIAVPQWVERGFTVAMGWLAKRFALHPMPTYYDLRVPGAIYVPLPTLLCYLYLPFFDSMRVWSRFGIISAFALAVLAGIGMAHLRVPSHESQAAGVRYALLIAAVIFELLSVPFPLGWSEVRSQSVDRWLAQQTGPGAVAVFPLWKAEQGPGLYASAVHGKPVVYGYGAFFPRRYRQERPILWDFPTAQAIALLHEWGVRYVLVGAKSYGAQWPDVQQRITQFSALHLVTMFDEEPLYHSGWLAESLPDFGRALIVDRVYVYELDTDA